MHEGVGGGVAAVQEQRAQQRLEAVGEHAVGPADQVARRPLLGHVQRQVALHVQPARKVVQGAPRDQALHHGAHGVLCRLGPPAAQRAQSATSNILVNILVHQMTGRTPASVCSYQ